MPLLSDALAGSLVVAVVSLVGLIISKETKVSEFRQAWIDALRDDIADLVSQAHMLHEANSLKDSHDSAAVIFKAMARIRLRLNMRNAEAKALAASMVDLGEAMESPATAETMHLQTEKVLSDSQILLKKEWGVVKNGEPFYKIVRYVLFVVVLVLVSVLLYKFFD